MKVLLSAYACEPGKGSEPEVGFQALLAAAARHDVWVLTRENNLASIEAFLDGHHLRPKIRLVGLEGPSWARRLKRALRGPGTHLYYDLWQREAGRVALTLDTTVDFDLVHHVTFANYWTKAGVASVNKPFLWGPVGGGVDAPRRLLGVLGLKGLLRDATRWFVRGGAELLPSHREVIRRATLTLAQNPETAVRLVRASKVEVAPHGTAALSLASSSSRIRRPEVLMVGRLIPYKAGVLAVDAFSRVHYDGLRLVIVGSGPERKRIEKRARRLGVLDRVEFTGPISRSEVLARMSEAAVLIHPALHDDSPLTVAEAMAAATPVVCLDHGGPPVVCRAFGEGSFIAVRVDGSRGTVADRLAQALESFLVDSERLSSGIKPLVSFGEMLLASYDKAAGVVEPRHS